MKTKFAGMAIVFLLCGIGLFSRTVTGIYDNTAGESRTRIIVNQPTAGSSKVRP